MLEIGTKQTLTIVKTVDFGVYLAKSSASRPADQVLLPAKQVPEGTKTGDILEVFLYLDSQDRPIATTREPRITLGEIALLPVKEVTRIGAFLDWGLEKDLLLPFHEQTKRVNQGEEVLVTLYLDKSQRLCASMKVYHQLSCQSPYKAGDMVEGRVYEIIDNFGVFVAVDDRYNALIPRQEAQGEYKPGDILSLRVTKVQEDGKLSVSARKKAYLQMQDDADHILARITSSEGSLPFDDKASPELIQKQTGLSKNAFKRAVGRLLKEEKIRIKDGHILLK
ncbi:MAG: S1 RNA-binding domain-containing protein [Blautia sp.]|nr:S1 RNA-binding domain-containing protein [Blautia sp.]